MGLAEGSEGAALPEDGLQVELLQIVQGVCQGLHDQPRQVLYLGVCRVPAATYTATEHLAN